MERKPDSLRPHIVLYGAVNAGKSSLMNALTAQETSIVSAAAGTTTDAVSKAMELLPFGPVVFVDTAGLDDQTELGFLSTRQVWMIKRSLERRGR